MILFEQPLWLQLLIVAAGLLGVVSLAALWRRSGRRIFLVLLGIEVVLCLGLLALNLHTTEKEQVEQTLRELAAAVERNDAAAVKSYIHSDAAELLAMADDWRSGWKFEEVDIKSNLQIEVDAGASPPAATARFNVVVRFEKGKGPGGEVADVFGDRGIARFVILEFEKENGAWKVRSLEHQQPQAGWSEGEESK